VNLPFNLEYVNLFHYFLRIQNLVKGQIVTLSLGLRF